MIHEPLPKVLAMVVLTLYSVTTLSCVNLLDPNSKMTVEKWEKHIGGETTQEIVDIYNSRNYLNNAQIESVLIAVKRLLPDVGIKKIRLMEYCMYIGNPSVEIKFFPHFQNDDYGIFTSVSCDTLNYSNFYSSADETACKSTENREIYVYDRSFTIDNEIEPKKARELIQYIYHLIDTDIGTLESALINNQIYSADYKGIEDPESFKASITNIYVNARDGLLMIGVHGLSNHWGFNIALDEIRCGLPKCGYKILYITEYWI